MKLFHTARGASIERFDAEPLLIGHVIGVGRNYAAHAQEQGVDQPEHPMLFTKNPAGVIFSHEDIVVPKICQDRPQVDYEGELAVVIGRRCRDVPLDDALSYVLGYCCANDVSARWWQKKGAGGQYCRGKSFDTFCPLGPTITPASEIADPQSLELTTRLNGETVQQASTQQMMFPVAMLIHEISRGATLLPGAVILTGTPAGVGMSRTPPRYLEAGDVVQVVIAGLGTLENRVMFE